VRSHTALLGVLSRTLSSTIASLPPTVGASTLTVSLPEVTKETLERLLALFKGEWEEVVVGTDEVELASMLLMPIGVSGVRIKIKKEVQRKRMGVEELLQEVEDLIKEGEEEEEDTVKEPAGFEDNSTDEETEEEVVKKANKTKKCFIKLEPLENYHGDELLLTENETLPSEEDTGDLEKETNELSAERKKLEVMFKNLEMKLYGKPTESEKETIGEEGHQEKKEAEKEEVELDQDKPSLRSSTDTKCPECDMVLSDSEEFRFHMGEVHMEEELEAVVGKIFPGGQEKCTKCGEEVESEYVKKEHIMAQHAWPALAAVLQDVAGEDMEVYNEDEVFSESDEDNDEATEDPKKAENKQKGSEVKSERKGKGFPKFWYSGIEYTCKHCSALVSNIASLRVHLKTKHNISAAMKEAESHAEYKDSDYTCKICDKKVKHERTNIETHMRIHSLTTKEYGLKYEGEGLLPKPSQGTPKRTLEDYGWSSKAKKSKV